MLSYLKPFSFLKNPICRKVGISIFGITSYYQYQKHFSKTSIQTNFSEKPLYTPKNYLSELCPIQSVVDPKVSIVAGPTSKQLAKDTAALLGLNLADIEIGAFRDGETYVKVKQN